MALIIHDNFILGNTAPNKEEYQALKPWTYPPGTPRWIIDNVNPEMTVNGHNVRLRTQAELLSDPVYQAWQTEQNVEVMKDQAKDDFETMPAWISSGTVLQAETYIENNVTDLASCKDALKKLVKVLILFRDYMNI